MQNLTSLMENRHICPWWMGYFLINPIRKSRHNPDQILGNFLKQGMTTADFGSAMGYFSLPMARMVGNEGRVYCFDIQQKMLAKLSSRASNAGFTEIIRPILINGNDDYQPFRETMDFILLFAVAHEVPDQARLFSDLASMMKPGSLLLFAEPSGHVKQGDFQNALALAGKAGLKKIQDLSVNRSYASLLKK